MEKNGYINILFVDSSSGFGGSTKSLFYLIKFLDKNKFHPYLVITEAEPGVDDFISLCSKLYYFKRKRDPVYKFIRSQHSNNFFKYCSILAELSMFVFLEVFKFIAIIKKNKIDIIHLNDGLTSNFSALLAAKLLKIPIVVHARGTPEKKGKNVNHVLNLKRNKISANFVDLFISVTDRVSEELKKATNYKYTNIVTIRDGLDFSELDLQNLKNIRDEIKVGKEHFLISLISNFLPRKGQHVFIEAAREVIKKHSNIKFVLAGREHDTNYYQTVVNKINEHGLSEYFLLLGYRTDIANLIYSSDLIVMSAVLPEGCPRVLMEAMAIGKPIVGSNVGGINEIIENQKNGLLVVANNSLALAEGISNIIENRETAKNFGLVGQQIAREKFDFKKNILFLQEIYEKFFFGRENCQKVHKKIALALLYHAKVFSILRCLKPNNAGILMYHKIEKYNFENNSVSIENFEKQMQYAKNNFNLVSLDDLANFLKNKKIPRNALAVTFDDGHSSVYKLAYPVLKKFNIPATIFVAFEAVENRSLIWTDEIDYMIQYSEIKPLDLSINGQNFHFELSDWYSKFSAAKKIKENLKKVSEVEKSEIIALLKKSLGSVNVKINLQDFMITWNQAREMIESRVSFGAHTLTHPILTKVSIEKAGFEIAESKRRLESCLNRPVLSFAYPNGEKDDINEEIKNKVKENGFLCACTTIFGNNYVNADLFELKRIYVKNCSLSVFAAHLFNC